jgi:hypothetical protein
MRCPPPHQEDPGTRFCSMVSKSQGHRAAWRIRSIENINYLTGNRTRNLSCGIVPQQTTLPQYDIRRTIVDFRVLYSVLDNLNAYLEPFFSLSGRKSQLHRELRLTLAHGLVASAEECTCHYGSCRQQCHCSPQPVIHIQVNSPWFLELRFGFQSGAPPQCLDCFC